MRVLSLILLLLVGSISVHAAVTYFPPAPTSAEVIRARIEVLTPGGCFATPTTTITGSTIRTTVRFTGCAIGPPPSIAPVNAFFGPVAPGTYAHEIYTQYENAAPVFQEQLTLAVEPVVAPVPALSVPMLTALAAAIAVLALIVVRRG